MKFHQIDEYLFPKGPEWPEDACGISLYNKYMQEGKKSKRKGQSNLQDVLAVLSCDKTPG